jgi:hypothetical protein
MCPTATRRSLGFRLSTGAIVMRPGGLCPMFERQDRLWPLGCETGRGRDDSRELGVASDALEGPVPASSGRGQPILDLLDKAIGLQTPLVRKNIARARQRNPEATPAEVVRTLGRNFITKYGTKQGIIVLGRIAPFGIGAVIGGGANATVAALAVRAARRAFGPAPQSWAATWPEPTPESLHETPPGVALGIVPGPAPETNPGSRPQTG